MTKDHAGPSFATPASMSRDVTKLRVFGEADDLVVRVYKVTKQLPESEQFGLQTQMRRAAISVTTNIAEGAGRSRRREYAHFLNIANGSAFEIRYLLGISTRLGMLAETETTPLIAAYTVLAKELHCLMSAVERG